MDNPDKVQIIWHVAKYEPGYSGPSFTMRATYKGKDKYFVLALDPEVGLDENLVLVAKSIENLIGTVQE